MGFLQDLGGFIEEVNSLGGEIKDIKQDVVSSIVTSVTDVSQTLSDTATEITSSVKDVGATVQQAASLPTDAGDPTTEGTPSGE